MSERRALTKTIATRYARSDRAGKKVIVDELCATTGWRRAHARKAPRSALVLLPVHSSGELRAPLYGEPVIEELLFLWAVRGTPCGRLLAASMPDLVPRLRRLGELDVDDATAVLLLKIAPVQRVPIVLREDRRRSATMPAEHGYLPVAIAHTPRTDLERILLTMNLGGTRS